MVLRCPVRCTAAMALAVLALSCSSSEVTFGGPLDLQIAANSPVSVADSLQLDYDITGRSLLGMEVLWGDSGLDSLFFSGAQTASGRVRHLYAAEGTYTVTARVVDQAEGTQTKTLTVTVDP